MTDQTNERLLEILQRPRRIDEQNALADLERDVRILAQAVLTMREFLELPETPAENAEKFDYEYTFRGIRNDR